MQHATVVKDFKININQMGNLRISKNNNINVIKMKKHKQKLSNKDIEKHLLNAEEDIKKRESKRSKRSF